MDTVQIGEIYGKCPRHPKDRRAGYYPVPTLPAVLERPTRCKMALPRTDHEAYRSVGCPVAGMFLEGMFRGRHVRPRLAGMLPIPT